MKPPPPFIGAAYYPEAWPEAEIDRDIARMKDIGLSLARIGEFAWSSMEPKEGAYEFGWLRQVMDKLGEAGIAVMLCTPTATPPAWLSEKHPQILRFNDLGLQIQHGGRRQYCPNSAVYRQYSRKIVERMANELGNYPQLVAWQIDNELFEDCYCQQCERAFRAWLAARFGSIEHLNAAWNTALWSQDYQSFDQVPLPNAKRIGASHHPSLIRAYHHFISDSYVSYSNEQAATLRAYTSAPITTNAHSAYWHKMEYEALYRDLDFVAHDCYAAPNNLARYAFEADWMRPLKSRPFWFTETASTYPGSQAASDRDSFAHVPGSLRAKMWLMYASGADAVSFWLWRTHWAGQEQEHGALLYVWGEECINTSEIRQVGRDLAQHGEWLASTSPKPASVAVHYTVATQWILDIGSIGADLRYDTAISAYHKLLFDMGISRDMIPPDMPVDCYKVVCSAYQPAFDAQQMARMQQFVENGGTWVLGPLSACRTPEATAYLDGAYSGALEAWLGVGVRHRMPASSKIGLVGEMGESPSQFWCDVYTPGSEARVLAKYTGAPLAGMPAVVESKIGKGKVILLGTLPDDAWLSSLLRYAIAPTAPLGSPGVAVMERVDTNGAPAGLIAVNTGEQEGTLHLPNGEEIALAPYGVFIAPEPEAGS